MQKQFRFVAFRCELSFRTGQHELDNDTNTKTSFSFHSRSKTHSLQQRPRLTRNALHGDITDRHCVTARAVRPLIQLTLKCMKRGKYRISTMQMPECIHALFRREYKVRTNTMNTYNGIRERFRIGAGGHGSTCGEVLILWHKKLFMHRLSCFLCTLLLQLTVKNLVLYNCNII